ncbi:hypothetical protein M422DRAFT_239206 [Sphaerobolus stellatus SS14]|nr:hypothetical protein M422DRAFT_239206 [Sphaerobolus stellatus SS14]
MAMDENRHGVPIVFLLFSAPTGSQATHAGYNTEIMTELLWAWVVALGKDAKSQSFCPKVAITDTDIKERGALITVWPSIFLLLCKFHTRMCWSNKRKTLIKTGNSVDFFKQQIISRLRALDGNLILTSDYQTAMNLVEEERKYLTMMTTNPDTSAPAKNGLAYLEYLIGTWLVESLWKSWSQYGRNEAAKILDVDVKEVAPTTNHLESFNGVLKRKYIRGYQKGGKRIHFDLLIFLLVMQVLPGIFKQHQAVFTFYDWVSQRFTHYAGGRNLVQARAAIQKPRISDPIRKKFEFTWWTSEGQTNGEDEIAHTVSSKLGGFEILAGLPLT